MSNLQVAILTGYERAISYNISNLSSVSSNLYFSNRYEVSDVQSTCQRQIFLFQKNCMVSKRKLVLVQFVLNCTYGFKAVCLHIIE